MGGQEERRALRRWVCLMPCRCDGQDVSFDGCIVNLSYGGAGIVTDSKLPPEGAELLVTIRPVHERVRMHARVVWNDSAGAERGLANFGLEFIGSLEERRDKIRIFEPTYFGDEE